jgi:hypothetical protein
MLNLARDADEWVRNAPGQDNERDGEIDVADLQCTSALDNHEGT